MEFSICCEKRVAVSLLSVISLSPQVMGLRVGKGRHPLLRLLWLSRED